MVIVARTRPTKSSSSSASYDIEAFDWFERADKYCVGNVLDIRDDIELVVHAVNEIDVCRAADAVHCLSAIRATTTVGVRRAIFGAAIGFSFNDYSADTSTAPVWDDQLFAEQITRDFEGVGTGVEFARKFHASYPQITQITLKEIIHEKP